MKKLYYTSNILLLLVLVLLVSCKKSETVKENPEAKPHKTVEYKKPASIGFHFEKTKQWLETNKSDSTKLDIVYAINRTDKANFAKKDSVVIPTDFNGDLASYLPFPFHVSNLKDVSKVLIFSYQTQTFAAYEYGELVYTGPTNMGRKKDQTPTGLFFTNWKAEKTTSTFNDEWDLKWNFNIENKLGVGFHEYELPGYPASHSCLRLLEKDAKYLYKWADEWILKDKENVKVKGTPVIVFGSYDFDGPKPWYALVSDPKALDISESEIETQTEPFIQKILENQKVREGNTTDTP
ncbi:L,D-transpeptidase [Flavobacterium sp. ANB]|uniref:L,D-transpeptidase n=1 Tax=unclassified Flavobacterium TaxID=196869 RepID=UPI0012B9FD57|nr:MULTISPECIES: L,D-transpeptidase [unclassified Flavobacterium]MBF4516263.1 L,D-transpeptidase [Flavobacterium sp. ANB]MTD69840.1 L,D-transpeptidase family protein [Flavobacterium sp. LC2016-13]